MLTDWLTSLAVERFAGLEQLLFALVKGVAVSRGKKSKSVLPSTACGSTAPRCCAWRLIIQHHPALRVFDEDIVRQVINPASAEGCAVPPVRWCVLECGIPTARWRHAASASSGDGGSARDEIPSRTVSRAIPTAP